MRPQSALSAKHSASDSFAASAKWLHDGGWPLEALVDRFATNEQLDEEMDCLATAVFFEARGESLDGQLAVARVVINRAASGKYPPTWCATVKQPWQFSFVRKGQFPYVDKNSALWARAQSVAKIAAANIVPSLSGDVLWYHADYVSPAWGPRLVRVEKIGAHIFYPLIFASALHRPVSALTAFTGDSHGRNEGQQWPVGIPAGISVSYREARGCSGFWSSKTIRNLHKR